MKVSLSIVALTKPLFMEKIIIVYLFTNIGPEGNLYAEACRQI